MEGTSHSSSSGNVIHACSLLFPPMSMELYDVDGYDSFLSLRSPTGLLFANLRYRGRYTNDDGSEGDEDVYSYHVITSSVSVLGYAARYTKEGFRTLSWPEWGPGSSKIFIQNLDLDDRVHNA